MRTFLVIFAFNSSLVSIISASLVDFQSISEGLPSCALDCGAYRSAQRLCLIQSYNGNNEYNFATCFCDLFLSWNLERARKEYGGNSGIHVGSTSCTREDEMNALMEWSHMKCHRAGTRRQEQAAAADEAATAAPADPTPAAPAAAAPGVAPTADPGNQAGQSGQTDQTNQGNQNQPANSDTGTPTPDNAMYPPFQSPSETKSTSPLHSVHISEEPKEKPSEWNRAEELAKLQEQALNAASASSGGKPGMSANPLISESTTSVQKPRQQLCNSSQTAAANGSNNDLELNTPVVGFTHTPGTRYTAYDHMMAEQRLQEDEQRQRSGSSSALSKMSSLFGRSPKSPRDMISSRRNSPAWNTPGRETPLAGETDQLAYPAPAKAGKS
ncbi:hypothetical protein KEM54_005386 [Ascosphaera aggregata]|nr:hypothetical protein KEM54_005386 [Ascosphaera aggregata]